MQIVHLYVIQLAIPLFCFFICRGDTFRWSFSRLGEIRSIIPPSINVMALTATASRATTKVIIRTLGMQKKLHTSSFNPS